MHDGHIICAGTTLTLPSRREMRLVIISPPIAGYRSGWDAALPGHSARHYVEEFGTPAGQCSRWTGSGVRVGRSPRVVWTGLRNCVSRAAVVYVGRITRVRVRWAASVRVGGVVRVGRDPYSFGRVSVVRVGWVPRIIRIDWAARVRVVGCGVR